MLSTPDYLACLPVSVSSIMIGRPYKYTNEWINNVRKVSYVTLHLLCNLFLPLDGVVYNNYDHVDA